MADRLHQVLSHGRFLQITGAQVADTGRYSCLASNSAGDRSRHFNLNVLGTNATSRLVNSKINVKPERRHKLNLDECWRFTLNTFFFSPSVSHYSCIGPRRFCWGGDGHPQQSHLSAVRGPVLPPRPNHLAERRHSLWVESQRPRPPRSAVITSSQWSSV